MKWRRDCRKKDCRHQTKNTRVSTLVQGSSRDAGPKRSHRAAVSTLCRPLPAHPSPPSKSSSCLLRRLTAAAAGAAQHARLAEASSALVLRIPFPGHHHPRRDSSHTQQLLAAALLQAPCHFDPRGSMASPNGISSASVDLANG